MDDVDWKYYRAELEEHDDVVVELKEFYLMDVAPQDGIFVFWWAFGNFKQISNGLILSIQI